MSGFSQATGTQLVLFDKQQSYSSQRDDALRLLIARYPAEAMYCVIPSSPTQFIADTAFELKREDAA